MSITEEEHFRNYLDAMCAKDNRTITPEQFHIEELNYLKVIKEIEEKECPPEHFDEYRVCKHCGWRSEFPHSHAIQSMHKSCKFMKTHYKVYIDEDGEVICEEK